MPVGVSTGELAVGAEAGGTSLGIGLSLLMISMSAEAGVKPSIG